MFENVAGFVKAQNHLPGWTKENSLCEMHQMLRRGITLSFTFAQVDIWVEYTFVYL